MHLVKLGMMVLLVSLNCPSLGVLWFYWLPLASATGCCWLLSCPFSSLHHLPLATACPRAELCTPSRRRAWMPGRRWSTSSWTCDGGDVVWWLGKGRQDLPRASDACLTCLLLWEHWTGDEGRAMGATYHEPLRSGTWFPMVSHGLLTGRVGKCGQEKRRRWVET